jgi:hypothetical protein
MSRSLMVARRITVAEPIAGLENEGRSMDWVIGVDGCPDGWAIVLRSSDGQHFAFRIIASVGELLRLKLMPAYTADNIRLHHAR